MFAHLKLRQRILLGYLAPLLLLVGAMVVVYVNMQELSRSSDQHDIKQEIMFEVQGINLNMVRMERAVRGYLLKKNPESLKHYQDNLSEYKSRYEILLRKMQDPQQTETLRHIGELAKQLDQIQQRMMVMTEQGREAAALALYRTDEGRKIENELDEMAGVFEQAEMKIVGQMGETEATDVRTVINLVVYGMLASIALSVAIALWLASAISRNIIASASQLSAASSEIAATIAQHERTASQQASAVNETSATIDELSASSRQSAEQAANSAALAERSSIATTEGGESTQQAVEAMNSLKDKIGAMADQILHLGEQSGQIGSIATLLKDLAGQINMLALNAAVEAARAGEHGKGFAVVAGEIRKLADQSKKSAEQTAVLVADIQKATNTSIMVTEEGTRTVTEVTQLVRRVADLFSNLASLADSVNENAQQMMLNTKQQSAAFAQVVEATNSISAGAKDTVAGISQTKIGVQNLNGAAEKLKAMV